MRASSPEPLPLADVASSSSSAGKGNQRLVAVSGTAVVSGSSSGSGSGGGAPAATVVMELHASRQAALRAREWPLQGVSLPVYGVYGSVGGSGLGGPVVWP